MKGAVRSILFGQAILYAGLATCVLIKPSGLAVNAGISYYGIYRDTFLPYAIGLLGSAYFAVRAIDQLPTDEKILRLSLKAFAPLIVGIVVTPYAAGWLTYYLHTACGSALFLLQLALSCYAIRRLHYPPWGIALALIMLTSGLLSAIYLSPTHGFLFQAQVIFQFAFGVLIILSLSKLLVTKSTAVESEIANR